MGKKIIPPQDPERLARVMDEKTRMFGVDVNELSRQAAERKQAEEAEARRRQEEEHRQAQVDLELYKRRAAAEEAKRRAAAKVANQLKHQMVEKQAKDEHARELYGSNELKEKYFKQFGTSHR